MTNTTSSLAAISDCVVGGIELYENYFDECDWEIILPDGIQLGVSTKEDIIAAYGEPNYASESFYYSSLEYSVGELSMNNYIHLNVSKEIGVLAEIWIRNLPQSE